MKKITMDIFTIEDNDPNSIKFAKKELLELYNKDRHQEAPLSSLGDEMQLYASKCVLDLLTVFSEQGHSGSSAAYVLGVVNRLVSFKPLLPLTGEDSEWDMVYEGVYQNKKCSSVYKRNDIVYDSDKFVFSDDGGLSWFSTNLVRINEKIISGDKLNINITFPYSPPSAPEKIYLVKCKNGSSEEYYVNITGNDSTINLVKDRCMAELKKGER